MKIIKYRTLGSNRHGDNKSVLNSIMRSGGPDLQLQIAFYLLNMGLVMDLIKFLRDLQTPKTGVPGLPAIATASDSTTDRTGLPFHKT